MLEREEFPREGPASAVASRSAGLRKEEEENDGRYGADEWPLIPTRHGFDTAIHWYPDR
jgi:hypothetical protein